MNRRERLLVLVLRIACVPLLSALPCALLPFSWMDGTHRWLGLGPLPDAPIVSYLARSCSLFYAWHGALLLFATFDVRRYLALLQFLAWAGVVFGFGLVWVDWTAGLPMYWRWLEGPAVVGECGIILWLVKWVAHQPEQATG